MTDALPRLGGAFDGSDERTLDRRQLLRAGAWAAPVIVLATAAPAAAAESGVATPLTPATWEFSAPSLAFGGAGYPKTTLVTSATVKNTSGSANITEAITLTATFAKSLLGATAPVVSNLTGAGWVQSGAASSVGADWVYTFTNAATIAAGTSSATLSFALSSAAIGQASSASVSLNATSTRVTPGLLTVTATASQPAPVGTLPIAKLSSGTFGVWNNSGSGVRGPFKGNLQIDFNGDNAYNPTSPASVPYQIEVLVPGSSTWAPATSGVASVNVSKWYGGTQLDWSYGASNMAAGQYTFRVILTGSDGSAEKKRITFTP